MNKDTDEKKELITLILTIITLILTIILFIKVVFI